RALALVGAPRGECPGDLWVGDEMTTVRGHRQEAACQLVFTLGTRFEPAKSLTQAIFDALVIAGLEMQARGMVFAAPVPSIQRVGTAQEECTCDAAGMVVSEDEDQRARHRSREMSEERQGQRWRIAFFRECHAVEVM